MNNSTSDSDVCVRHCDKTFLAILYCFRVLRVLRVNLRPVRRENRLRQAHLKPSREKRIQFMRFLISPKSSSGGLWDKRTRSDVYKVWVVTRQQTKTESYVYFYTIEIYCAMLFVFCLFFDICCKFVRHIHPSTLFLFLFHSSGFAACQAICNDLPG